MLRFHLPKRLFFKVKFSKFVEISFLNPMKNSRVFTLFSQFSAKERRAFRKFVRSPFHNPRDDARRLYDYLLDHYRKPALLERPLVFDHCYPNTPYNDAKMRQVLTHLCRLMEQFLAVDRLLNDQVKVRLEVARVLKDKNLENLANQNLQKAEDLLNERSFRDRVYYETSYQILFERHQAFAKKGRGTTIDLQPLNQALEVGFILEKLNQACYALTQQNVVKTDLAAGLTDAIIQYIEQNDLLDQTPAIRLYYAAYKILRPDAEEKWFYDLKAKLVEHQHLLPKEELRSLLIFAINFGIKKTNEGQREFIKECFFLYKYGLQHDLFMIHGELSRFTYKNIVTSGLVLGEFDWTENFIYQYKDRLAAVYRESHFSYNLSKLYFSRKDYDAAMQLLVKVEYDDLFLNLDAKTVLLKIYYEIGEWDALDSLLASFTTFLRRKKVMGYHKANYQNIISLTRKMSLLGQHNPGDRPVVQQLIHDTTPNTEKKWMLEQLG